MSHVENIEKMMDCLASIAKSELDKGTENIDAKEMGEVMDMIKDLSEAKYYCSITKAMEEFEYGVDYDEEGRLSYTPMRNQRTGRFVSRRGYDNYPMEEYRDNMYATRMPRSNYSRGMSNEGRSSTVRMNGNSNGQMYFTEEGSKYGDSYDKFLYERKMLSKDKPEDVRKRKELLTDFMDDVEDMANSIVNEMSSEEKQMWRSKLNKLINM